ncbi:MAG: hypothetical protein IT378_19245, partial [Sandaracinaceae bacterium]|nr:hypothetical protein [Sandaracinaceae bacterium]
MSLDAPTRALLEDLFHLAVCTRTGDLARALARALEAHTRVERARVGLGRPHGERVGFAWARGLEIAQLRAAEGSASFGGHRLALTSGGDEVGELEVAPMAAADHDAVALA